MIRSGRHFLQVPGPTNVPDRVLRAMDRPVVDHRSAEFKSLGNEALEGIRTIFKTDGPVVIYPGSGTGGWEASIVNTLSPGDTVVLFETGHFSLLWCQLAKNFGLHVEYLPGNWRHGARPQDLEARLAADPEHTIKAILAIHNETSTGVTSDIAGIRRVIDAQAHPALLIVDAISSLGSIDYRHQEWKVDVSISCSQKGLMLPPGLSFNAISDKALAANKQARLARSYWDWQPMLNTNRDGFFPYTPATNLLYGLREAIHMLHEEGLQQVFRRHQWHGEATRAAVRGWGLDLVCNESNEYSNSVTAVFLPEGYDADRFRQTILDHFDLSLGAGLSKLARKAFRIGHLGSLNDLMLIGALGGIEMGLQLENIPHCARGVQAALAYLCQRLAAHNAIA
jgi:alanine-glyoxylate transaminase / serine-glyoxylate transaminase / serine-pyruvate transaminase